MLTIAPASIVDVATTDMVLATLFGYGALLGVGLLMACAVIVARLGFAWVFGRDLGAHMCADDLGFALRPDARYSHAYADIGSWTIRWGAIVCGLALLTVMYPKAPLFHRPGLSPACWYPAP